MSATYSYHWLQRKGGPYRNNHRAVCYETGKRCSGPLYFSHDCYERANGRASSQNPLSLSPLFRGTANRPHRSDPTPICSWSNLSSPSTPTSPSRILWTRRVQMRLEPPMGDRGTGPIHDPTPSFFLDLSKGGTLLIGPKCTIFVFSFVLPKVPLVRSPSRVQLYLSVEKRRPRTHCQSPRHPSLLYQTLVVPDTGDSPLSDVSSVSNPLPSVSPTPIPVLVTCSWKANKRIYLGKLKGFAK